MGIPGLTSLVQDDRTRFGSAWCLGPETSPSSDPIGTTIYIDGPGLLYHLISQKSLPHSSCESVPFPLHQPSTVYERTRLFLQSYLDHGSAVRSIHLVMDGLAHPWKQSQQLSRMEERHRILTEKTSVSFRKVPHLFAEVAMAEACLDLDDPKLHYSVAEGEAEEEIISMIARQESGRTVVISNDSDFLIHPQSPGYVPISSLETDLSDGVIRGWCFDRVRFQKAYNLPAYSLPAVAAFAGCDYTVSDPVSRALRNARRIIWKSPVAGLRNRDKAFPPSRKIALMGVLRFVSHYSKSEGGNCDGGEDNQFWIRSVAWAAAGEGKGREERCLELMDVIREVGSIYCHGEKRGKRERDNFSTKNAELRRILERAIFICRPIVEPRRIKSSKKKSKKQHDSCVSRTDPPGEFCTLWMNPLFVVFRKRFYYILSKTPRHASNTHTHGLGSSSGVMEYYIDENKVFTSKLCEPIQPLSGTTIHMHDKISLISYCLSLKEQQLLKASLSVPIKYHHTFYAGGLLFFQYPKAALFLGIMATAPHRSTFHLRDDIDTDTEKLSLKSYTYISMIQIACHHMFLLISSAFPDDNFSPVQTFHEGLFLPFMKFLEEVETDGHGDDDRDTSLIHNMCLSEQLLDLLLGFMCVGMNDFDVGMWRDRVVLIWDAWCQLKPL